MFKIKNQSTIYHMFVIKEKYFFYINLLIKTRMTEKLYISILSDSGQRLGQKLYGNYVLY